jgi:ABC-type antimicrobial peptide transport system permease subunit
MSLPAAQLLLHTDSFNVIMVKAKNESSVTPLSNLISQVYGNNARILNVQQIAATASSIIGAITTLFAIVAGISLMVAAIGIMNVMLMAVMERTREIGIMKSVGFKSRDILSIFIVQAMLIGLVGGIIGIVVGAGVSYALAGAASGSHSSTASSGGAGSASFSGGGGFGGGGGTSGPPSGSFSFTPLITPTAIVEALFAAVAVSVIAGIYPAWRASRMQPIDALRSL